MKFPSSFLPKTFDFLSSLLLGSFFIWFFLLINAIGKEDSHLINSLISLYNIEHQSEINWVFIIFLSFLSYIIGEFFIALGDILLTTRFRGRYVSVEDFASALWKKKTVLVEKITPILKYPELTTDTFLFLEENYHTKRSEYYYFRSNLFTGIFLSLIVAISVPFLTKEMFFFFL